MHDDKYATSDYLVNELKRIGDSTSGVQTKDKNSQFTQEEIKLIKHILYIVYHINWRSEN